MCNTNNNYITVILCLSLLCNFASAQNFQIQTREYYWSERLVTIKCNDCELRGSLVIPENDTIVNSVALIIGGSTIDRNGNQSIMRPNIFQMLALDLAMNNIASVRFDQRGVGASVMLTDGPEQLLFDQYVEDARKWITKIRKDLSFRKIILIGHSEGVNIALAAAANNNNIDAVITVSGVGRTTAQFLKDQQSHQTPQIREIACSIIDTLYSGRTVDHIPVFLSSYLSSSVQPYLISSMKHDPQEDAKRIKIPMLVLQGDNDVEISAEDGKLLAKANGKAKFVMISNMNHLMKDCFSTSQTEQKMTYFNPALPPNRQLVEEIVDFISGLK